MNAMPLSVLARNPSHPQAQPLRAKMTGDRLTVGRSTENDLVLPDPEKYLSKRHCVLERRGHDYVLLDTSTNGTFLNYGSERLDRAPAPLSQGDVILIGQFELVVDIKATLLEPPAAELPPLEEAQGPITANHAIRPGPAPLDPMEEAGDAGDFLNDLLGEPAASSPADPARLPGASLPDHAPATSAHFAPPRASGQLIPDDWEDSLIAPLPTGGAAPSPAPSPARSAPPPPPMMPQSAPAHPAQPPALPDAAPLATLPPSSPAPTAQAAHSGGAQDAALLRAFLNGAGASHLALSPQEAEEVMARAGRIMAATIEGLRDILMTRAALKSEMRVNRTMIQAEANNPLKFSISKEQAVEAMLKPSSPGYQDPEAAVNEVLRDIKAHEVATMTGMEAALRDLLAQLGPDRLSERIEQNSGLASRIGSKKARYWDAYEAHYADIARATENDFQSTFGKEFSRAYEDQIKKL